MTLRNGIEGGCKRFLASDIRDLSKYLPSTRLQFGGSLFKTFLVNVSDGDDCAIVGHHFGIRIADAARAASDNCDLAGDVEQVLNFHFKFLCAKTTLPSPAEGEGS